MDFLLNVYSCNYERNTTSGRNYFLVFIIHWNHYATQQNLAMDRRADIGQCVLARDIASQRLTERGWAGPRWLVQDLYSNKVQYCTNKYFKSRHAKMDRAWKEILSYKFQFSFIQSTRLLAGLKPLLREPLLSNTYRYEPKICKKSGYNSLN